MLELLDLVKLPALIAKPQPGGLSGGQKQRVNLARALAAKPELILCDEVTSALDTVVGAAILELLAELRRELNVSYMFISHDISTGRAICDEVIVLYAGQCVEAGQRDALSHPPYHSYHPYTGLLVDSVPELQCNPAGSIRVARPRLPRCPRSDRKAARTNCASVRAARRASTASAM